MSDAPRGAWLPAALVTMALGGLVLLALGVGGAAIPEWVGWLGLGLLLAAPWLVALERLSAALAERRRAQALVALALLAVAILAITLSLAQSRVPQENGSPPVPPAEAGPGGDQ